MGGNLQKDISGSEKEKQKPGLELVKGEELDNVAKAIDDLSGKIEGDKKVTGDDVLKLDEALGKVKVDFYGDEMTVDEIKKIPDLKENMKLWKGIEKGEDNTSKVTYITKNIARKLMIKATSNFYNSAIRFDKLKILPDDVAEVIAGLTHRFFSMYFNSLDFLSDKAIESLCSSEAKVLGLKFVNNLSENAIKMLAEKMLAEDDKTFLLSDETKKRVEEYWAKK